METNRQNYMMDNNMHHLNVAGAGDGVVGGVQSEVVSGVAGEILGGKYDEHHEEHDVGDDDELKYVKEEQQSEKQQQQQKQTLKNFGLDDGTYESNELAEKETPNASGHEFNNENGGFVFGGNHQIHKQQQHHDLFNIGNGHDTNGHDVNTNDGFDNLTSTGFEEKLNMMQSELDSFKNEGDFYPPSNVVEVDAIVPQIDVKIEARVEHHEMVDEEEPSSLATNTTNGTSSLSENVPPQAVVSPHANAFDDVIANLEDKENSDPLITQRPKDLDLDQAHSQLNPDAKEFIPSFGSNPASPTSPFATEMPQNESVLNDIVETQMYFGQASSVPQHLCSDDDFVAQSPRKGKDDNNMDAVSLPILSEFEQEADKRPHELEPQGIDIFHQRDEVMTPDQAIQQLPLDDLEAQNKEKDFFSDSTDFQSSNFMDHGPETCVDLEADLDIQQPLQGEDDVMKRSMYVTSEDVIEDVLNSVQPIPTEIESINNSFGEESATESAANQLAGDKELLQIEEKEHVSHSPSTEEIQMNLQNPFNSSNKDIPQLPIDMDNANNMQESIYMEHEQSGQHDPKQEKGDIEQILFQQTPKAETDVYQFQEQKEYQEEIQTIHTQPEHGLHTDEHDLENQQSHERQLLEQPPQKDNELDYGQQPIHDVITEPDEESLLADTTNPLKTSASFLDNVLDTQVLQQETNESFSPFKITNEESNVPAIVSSNLDATEYQRGTTISDFLTPSFAEDEKNLVDESKNQLSISGLEQQMSEILLNNTDDSLSKAETIATTTATIAMEDITENLFSSDEAVVQEQHEQTHEQMFVDDSFNQHEQECLEQHLQELQQQQEMDITPDKVKESIESPIEQEPQQQVESEMVVVDEPIIEDKQATPLFTNDETEIVMKTEKSEEIASCMLPETHPAELLESHLTESEIEIVKSVEDPLEQQIEEVKTETIKEPEVEELKTKEENIVKDEIVPVEAVIAAATSAAVTSAAIAEKEASSASKNKGEPVKKPLSKTATTAAKPKLTTTTAAKKPVESAKKTAGLAAKPRTAAAKQATAIADKKPIVRVAAAAATTTAARKPLSSTTTTSLKAAAKTTSSSTYTRMATAATSKTTTTSKPTTAPRTVPSSTTTARKPATTNGPLAKQRPSSGPAKPTTLGLPATNGAPKAKPTSSRETLTSHVRKTNSAPTGGKSPVKSSATNGVTKAASSTLSSRPKTSTLAASSIAGSAVKTFTARPAPKFTNSSTTTSTTTTTRRSTGSSSATASTTTNTIKATSTPLRKSSPNKPATGKTPTKSANTGVGSKSKTPVTKPVSSSNTAKPAPIRKPVDNTAVIANGEADANKKLTTTGEKITASTQEQHQQASTENGDLQAVQLEQQRNGDSTIPKQTEEQQQQSFLEPRDEQIPMDLINA